MNLALKNQLSAVCSSLFQVAITWDDEGFFGRNRLIFFTIRSRWKCCWDQVVEITAEEYMHGLMLRFKLDGAKEVCIDESIFGKLDDFIVELKKKYNGFDRDNYLYTTDEWDDIYLCWKENN